MPTALKTPTTPESNMWLEVQAKILGFGPGWTPPKSTAKSTPILLPKSRETEDLKLDLLVANHAGRNAVKRRSPSCPPDILGRLSEDIYRSAPPMTPREPGETSLQNEVQLQFPMRSRLNARRLDAYCDVPDTLPASFSDKFETPIKTLSSHFKWPLGKGPLHSSFQTFCQPKDRNTTQNIIVRTEAKKDPMPQRPSHCFNPLDTEFQTKASLAGYQWSFSDAAPQLNMLPSSMHRNANTSY